MGDMGELFNAQKAATKQHHAAMLAAADTAGWARHTAWHFSRKHSRGRFDWWPSTGKARFEGKMIYGHQRVNALIAQLFPKP